MVEIINIRSLSTKTKGNHMQIQRRKGAPDPPDPKVEREEKGRNALNSIKNSI
jgi:hypothetical protein